MNGNVSAARSALSYGLLLAVGAAVWWLVFLPIQHLHAGLDVRMHDAQRSITELQTALTSRQEKQARARAILTSLEAERITWTADTETMAVAELQQLIRKTILSNQGQITTSRFFADTQSGKVTVSTHFSIGIEGLSRMLHALESHRPYTFVDILSIRARDRYLHDSSTRGNAAGPPVVDIQLDLSAHTARVPGAD